MPYLFASLKIGIAASLVGAIVGELPVQQGGLGARMLAGSYYGQTAQIWAALFLAAGLAALLVWAVGGLERRTLRAMGRSRRERPSSPPLWSLWAAGWALNAWLAARSVAARPAGRRRWRCR